MKGTIFAAVALVVCGGGLVANESSVSVPKVGMTCSSVEGWSVEIFPESRGVTLVKLFNAKGDLLAENNHPTRLVAQSASGVSTFELAGWVEMGQTASLKVSENVSVMAFELNFDDGYPRFYPECDII